MCLLLLGEWLYYQMALIVLPLKLNLEVTAEPRTRIVAVVTRVAKVFFIDISSDNSKPPSQVAPQFPHMLLF
jgi:hypothetical protein